MPPRRSRLDPAEDDLDQPLDLGVHHFVRGPLDHLPLQVRARRCQGLPGSRAGNRLSTPTATWRFFAGVRIWKDRVVAAPHHGGTPGYGKPVTAGSAAPYTTSADVDLRGHQVPARVTSVMIVLSAGMRGASLRIRLVSASAHYQEIGRAVRSQAVPLPKEFTFSLF